MKSGVMAKERSLSAVIAEKFRQLRSGGRLIIRDVVGSEDAHQEVLLWCSDLDGEIPSPAELSRETKRDTVWLQHLSTRARFRLFA